MTKFKFWNIIPALFLVAPISFLSNPVKAQQIQFISKTGPKKVKVFYTPFLPANTMLVDSLAVDTVGLMTFNIDKPAMAMLYVDMLMPFTMCLQPGEITTVTFSKQGIAFSQPNAYYQHKKQQLGYTSASARTYMLPESLNLKQTIKAIDSFHTIEMAFLEPYKSALPGWFYEREKLLYHVQAQTAKIIAANKRQVSYADLIKIDPALKEVIKVPAHAELNFRPEYYMYLSFYFFKAYANDDAETYPVRHRKVIQAIQAAKFPASTIENYNIFWLSFMIPTVGNTTTLNEYVQLWQAAKQSITNKSSLLLIDGMLRGKANELNDVATLKKNSTIPAIDFEDEKGNKVSLSKWKGKWIYLDIWATWCAPCRIDMEKKKELGFDNLGDGIVLVNVCADSKRADWQNAINTLKPPGVNLYAGNDIKEQLLTSYQIKGYPHYVLIRPDGKIEQNAASGPSQVIDHLRKSALLSAKD
ncbi:TlpA family protein disulfide reductase [Chitinophaga filiformis]|uniref:Thiol-disulfide isomerase or thioredoxin n=1 Tax=Chitinophaga filiformis TaxID=104663 RepID=A0A1G7SUI7_CHIFI|nr:TlpA disulfide reductase family protein [Chitinophaga filiformis]SDG26628.1 Thiol-disulfide isomerase or thioredoxin [Chitinophaga filiformis]